MVVYSFYESDTRVMQYATALRKAGAVVDVIALRRNGLPIFGLVDDVNVYRIQQRTINEKGLLAYGFRILSFLARASFFLYRRHRQFPYDLVHVHNVPDFLVLTALPLRRMGVPVVLDIHDLLPEFYASKFRIHSDSPIFKTLTLVERWSAAMANHVIVANHVWRDRFAARSSQLGKCSVVRNYPDLDIFAAVPKAREWKKSGKILLTYPGSLNWHQGLDVAIKAMHIIADRIPDAEFHIYGEGSAKPELIELVRTLKLEQRVIFHDYLPSRDIARVMADTDLAIEPKRATSTFGNEALSTKILEFMALGVPVIASKTSIHAYYYDDSMIRYYENDDPMLLAAQIIRLVGDAELRATLVENASRYIETNSWDFRKDEYLSLVSMLVSRNQTSGLAMAPQ